MNTSAIAQNLASQGRGEDKMLVHMTPSEVQGLQALAMAKGGSLTINPETGLPEAGFLSDTFKAVAPTLVGAGLAYFGMPAWAAGLAVGGVEAVRQDDLSAGIMAGLGAYGGAGMANSFTAMGTPPNAAGGLKPGQGGLGLKGSTDFAPIDYSLTSDPIAGSLSGPTAGYERAYGFGADPSNYVDAIQPLQPLNPTYGFDSVGSGTGLQMSDLPPLNEAPMSTEIFKGTADNYIPVENQFIAPETGKQLSDVTRTEIIQSGPGGAYPEVGADKLLYRAPPTPNPTLEGVKQTFTGDGGFGRFKDAYVNEMGGNKKALLGAAGVLGSAADGYGAFDPKPFNVVEPEKSTYEGPYFPTERTARFRGMDAILGGEGREFQYFDDVNPVPNVRTATAAHGGLMSAKKMAEGGEFTQNTMEYIIPRDEDGNRIPSSELFKEKAEPFIIPRDENMEEIPMDLERIIQLLNAEKPKKMAQGGRYLDGPGDGVSDSIPATVDGEQPVLLSEGEYIIPAEVVSAVGNGSSDAGADKFTALVDNIMAKTRRVAKGKPNGADNMLKGLVAQV